MSDEAWQELSKEERNRYWDLFDRRFSFRPSMKSVHFPGIREPTPSLTWNIEAAWRDPDPLMRPTHAAFNERLNLTFRQLISPPESLVALDWNHPCFRFFPHRHVGSFVPVGCAKNEPASWQVPLLPDGDYYIFLSEERGFGTFAHPWEGTICLWGNELLDAVGELPLEGATLVRRDGVAV